MSRWLVGSSSSSRSVSGTSSRASATRRRSPPDMPATGASRSRSGISPPSTSRARTSPAHSCSARSPSTTERTVAPSGNSSRSASRPRRRPRAGADVARPLVLGAVAQHDGADRRALGELVPLGEQAEPQPARVGDAPGVGLGLPRDDGHQGALAAAVAADDADAVTLVQAEGDTVEQRFGSVGLGDALKIDQIHGAISLFAAGAPIVRPITR